MIQLYIGEGKGKTTAAIGQAIRALGWLRPVLFVQFLKNLDTGEKNILEKLDGVDFIRPTMRHKSFIWHMNEIELKETKEDIQAGFQDIINRISSQKYSLIVLDEVLDVIECGFLSEDLLVSTIKGVAVDTELLLTGRRAPEKIMNIANYVTQMVKVKHPYDSGVKARKGIEY